MYHRDPLARHFTLGDPRRPQTLSKFDAEFWEKRPLYSPATKERSGFFKGLFDIDALKVVAKEKV